MPNNIFSKIILIFTALAIAVFFAGINASVLITFLLSINFYAFGYYFNRRELNVAFFIVHIILSFFYPTFCFFFPLTAYLMYSVGYKKILLLFLLPLFYQFNTLSIPAVFAILLLLGLVLSFTMHNIRLEQTKQQFHKFRDDNEEYKKKLEKLNHELMEKQDYEIHVATIHERTRIAREIHDNVGHMLSRSILQVGALLGLCQVIVGTFLVSIFDEEKTFEQPLSLSKSRSTKGTQNTRTSWRRDLKLFSLFFLHQILYNYRCAILT